MTDDTKLNKRHKEWLSINWCSMLVMKPLRRATILKKIKTIDPWYVYVLWRDDLGKPIPFYVGKGTGRRLTQHTAPSDAINGHKSSIISKLKKLKIGERYTIAGAFKKEADALKFEIELIAFIGRADLNQGPLSNRTDGGDGTRGHIALSGGENPQARAVYADHKHFECVEDAAKAFEVTGGTITHRIKNGWIGYQYADEEQRPEKEGLLYRYRRPVNVPGGLFNSMSDAAAATNESVKSIYKRIRAGRIDYYYPEEGQRPRKTNNKACEINGEFYESQTIAAAVLGISKDNIGTRIRSSNFENWIDLSGTIDTIQKNPVKERKVWVDGIEYSTAAEAERATGTKAGTLLNQATSSNWPNVLAEGIEKKYRDSQLAKNNVDCHCYGIDYQSLSSCARALDIDVGTLKQRIRSPYRSEYSSTDPSLSVRCPKDGRQSFINLEIDGVFFKSVSAAHKETGEARVKIKKKLNDPNHPNYVRLN